MNLPPLAERQRPKTIDEYIGQEHLLGENAVLRKSIDSKIIPSIIFWGPPGVGKTTLANLIAVMLSRPFYALSAINSGVKEVRMVIQEASKQLNSRPILFIDEIHRFSKSQQDALLGAVEKGIITLIGATTENPSFEVISALLSRCQVYVLKPLTKDNLLAIIKKSLETDVCLKEKVVNIKEEEALLKLSGGDARKLLNTLELVVNAIEGNEISITNEVVTNCIQQNMVLYDKAGDNHYDTVSAFIKSIRGSDPNAALYYLARMIEGGEDPLFIARRLIILAAEDIGMANPTALVMANNCFQAVNIIGMPESRIILSQLAIYLASSNKSNSAYKAIKSAQEIVRDSGNLPIPLHIRNAPTKLMKELGYGKGYQYSHEFDNNFNNQEFLPEQLKGSKIYHPGKNKREEEIKDNLKKQWPKYRY